MLQIRSNTFETNSSSAHSLVIKNGFDYMSADDVKEALKWSLYEIPEEPGMFIYKPRRYDDENSFNRWPFQVLDTFEDKLMYLYAHAPVRKYPPSGKRTYTRYQREYYKITNMLKAYLPWLKGIDWCYCDNKPSSEATQFTGVLKRYNISMYEYLFNKNIIIICDGDEYNVWSGLKRDGLIAVNNIKKEYVYD